VLFAAGHLEDRDELAVARLLQIADRARPSLRRRNYRLLKGRAASISKQLSTSPTRFLRGPRRSDGCVGHQDRGTGRQGRSSGH